MKASETFVTTADGARLYAQTIGDGQQTIVVPNGTYLIADLEPLVEGRTLVFYDLRNRGRSDTETAIDRLKRGVLQDVDDLEAVRRHLGHERVDLVGHSFVGATVVLYARAFPDRVGRVVQLGPIAPVPGKTYPPDLAFDDGLLRSVFGQIGAIQAEMAQADPEARCRRFWEVLRAIYVTDPKDAPRADWGRCELANERASLRYLQEYVLPSLKGLGLSAAALAGVSAPVLTIHGTKDRSAAYGGGREWASLLPDARLVTVEGAGHAPWIEAPEVVFAAIRAFLGGAWPLGAERIGSA